MYQITPTGDPNSTTTSPQATQKALAALMQQAADSPEGLKALAAAMAEPIKAHIRHKTITPLLLTRDNLTPQQRPCYPIPDKVEAHWITKDGAVRCQEIGHHEVEGVTDIIHAKPILSLSDLASGNVGMLTDYEIMAADEVRKETDKRTIAVLSQAVPAKNTVEVAGTEVTEDALNTAISKLEDQELNVKYIVMRGGRFKDLKSWDLDPQTKNDLRVKGVIKNYGTGAILLTAAAKSDEIILVPDMEVGKYPIRQKLRTKVKEQDDFKVAVLAWQEVGQVITRPDYLAKVRILG